MKKIILSGVLAFASMFAFAYVAPAEHYCKNNSTLNDGLCFISNTNGVADCVTPTGNSTIKDCYGAVNN